MASSEKMSSEDAETLKRFSQELASLYEAKPPVSKAKMMQLTKVAMKGIRYYKHVVMAVEKFIHRCKPEYKLPGLYVIDSIVRQSKHQFGADKDVFAPRFGKNLESTLQAAATCLDDDRIKVIRILNLWVQNNVFDGAVLQSALDQLSQIKDEDSENIDSSEIIDFEKPKCDVTKKENAEIEKSGKDVKAEVRKKSEPGRSIKATPPTPSSNPENVKLVDPSLLQQIQKLTSTFMTQHHRKASESERKLTKRILADYKYSDDDEESSEEEASGKDDDDELDNRQNSADGKEEELSANLAAAAQNLLNNPQILQQIQKMQQSIRPTPVAPPSSSTTPAAVPPSSTTPSLVPPPPTVSSAAGHLAPPPPTPAMPEAGRHAGRHLAPPTASATAIVDFTVPPPAFQRHDRQTHLLASAPPPPPEVHPQIPFSRPYENQAMNCPPPAEPLPPGFGSGGSVASKSDRDERRRATDDSSHERSSSHRKHKSRDASRSRSRDRKRKRKSRSRSHDRHRRKSRSRSRSKDKRDYRERKSRGMIAVKPGHVCIYSRTLWFGRLPASCEPDEIKNALKDYGEPVSIDIIPPRGCAYIVMPDRKAAFKILDRLKDLKIQHRILKMAWAPGKGVKNESDYDWDWDVENGVSYISWEKIFAVKDFDLTPYVDGGMLDVDSLPEDVRKLYDANGKIPTTTTTAPLTQSPATSMPLTPSKTVPTPSTFLNAAGVGIGHPSNMPPHVLLQPFGGPVAPHSMLYPPMQPYNVPPPSVFPGQQPPAIVQRMLGSMGFQQIPPATSLLQPNTAVPIATYGKMGNAGPPMPFGTMRMPPPGFPLIGGVGMPPRRAALLPSRAAAAPIQNLVVGAPLNVSVGQRPLAAPPPFVGGEKPVNVVAAASGGETQRLPPSRTDRGEVAGYEKDALAPRRLMDVDSHPLMPEQQRQSYGSRYDDDDGKGMMTSSHRERYSGSGGERRDDDRRGGDRREGDRRDGDRRDDDRRDGDRRERRFGRDESDDADDGRRRFGRRDDYDYRGGYDDAGGGRWERRRGPAAFAGGIGRYQDRRFGTTNRDRNGHSRDQYDDYSSSRDRRRGEDNDDYSREQSTNNNRWMDSAKNESTAAAAVDLSDQYPFNKFKPANRDPGYEKSVQLATSDEIAVARADPFDKFKPANQKSSYERSVQSAMSDEIAVARADSSDKFEPANPDSSFEKSVQSATSDPFNIIESANPDSSFGKSVQSATSDPFDKFEPANLNSSYEESVQLATSDENRSIIDDSNLSVLPTNDGDRMESINQSDEGRLEVQISKEEASSNVESTDLPLGKSRDSSDQSIGDQTGSFIGSIVSEPSFNNSAVLDISSDTTENQSQILTEMDAGGPNLGTFVAPGETESIEEACVDEADAELSHTD